MRFVSPLRDVRLRDVSIVGGKNASLGEMLATLAPLGIRVPNGFAITADAYRHRLRAANLEDEIRKTLHGVRKEDVEDLVRRSDLIRDLILRAPLPVDLRAEIEAAYRLLSRDYGETATDVAVRSSATAEASSGVRQNGTIARRDRPRGLTTPTSRRSSSRAESTRSA